MKSRLLLRWSLQMLNGRLSSRGQGAPGHQMMRLMTALCGLIQQRPVLSPLSNWPTRFLPANKNLEMQVEVFRAYRPWLWTKICP